MISLSNPSDKFLVPLPEIQYKYRTNLQQADAKLQPFQSFEAGELMSAAMKVFLKNTGDLTRSGYRCQRHNIPCTGLAWEIYSKHQFL